MTEQYTYAVSRIHAKESGLLNFGDLDQLLLCPDFNSAIKLLADKGYGNGDEYMDFESMERGETNKLWSLIEELVHDMSPFEALLRQIDFHNLKASIKALYTSETPEDYFLEGGSVAPEVILEAVKLKNFSELPKPLRDAAETAIENFIKTGDGQECDIYIDKACLETIFDDGKSSGVPVIMKYADMLVALSDIKIAVRAARSGKSKAFLERSLARCEAINVDALAAAGAKGVEEIYNYLEFTDFKEAVDKLKESMSAFEKWFDNKIMELIKSQKSNPFTIAPIFAYVLAKQNEIKSVQVVMTAKKNNLNVELVRERIRDLYV